MRPSHYIALAVCVICGIFNDNMKWQGLLEISPPRPDIMVINAIMNASLKTDNNILA